MLSVCNCDLLCGVRATGRVPPRIGKELVQVRVWVISERSGGGNARREREREKREREKRERERGREGALGGDSHEAGPAPPP